MNNPNFTTNHSLEIKFEIWNDKHGDRIEVGSDRDSLGLIEIRYITEDGKTDSCISMTKDSATLMIKALQNIIEFHKND